MAGQITRLNPKLLVCERHDDHDEEDREVNRGEEDVHEILSLEKLNLGSPMKKKKLLVIHLNKFLAALVHSSEHAHSKDGPKPFGAVYKKLVFKRPFCDEFLEFCFERFDVGIWGAALKLVRLYDLGAGALVVSRDGRHISAFGLRADLAHIKGLVSVPATYQSRNVDPLVSLLFGEGRRKLLFVWGQEECTETELKALENGDKPIFLKELKKLWTKNISHPWPKGRYTPSNTLLMDASPYRALLNPPHCSIFPEPYMVEHVDDDELGANGGVRGYLEGVAGADDVPSYVKSHPFGQTPLSPTHPHWKYYSRILPK